MHLHGDPAVNFRAGDLFENGAALTRRCMKEGIEASLGEEHGTREALEVHAGRLLDEIVHLVDPGLEDGPGIGIGYFVPGLLQFAFRFFPGAALAPVAAVPALLRLERDLGEAFPGLARHDLVAALRNLVEPGRPAV